ncbi:ABC transporter ATP-binding protein [Alteromonas facilis]|uniref:ABC transporter ATP-binding protein n=1 Tax=Alteromonas facilis TaxID=2048004 RepID=UPI001F0CC55E|nr:ABC transporter ATP-binding protein [Alteromonas facilis]
MPKSKANAIDVRDLTFRYSEDSPLVLSIPKWQVTDGEHLFVVGASGSGKSTLLNLICGTLTPSSGDIQLLQQPFSALSSRRRDRFRAQHVGVVFQQFNLIPYLTVEQNIKAAAYFGGNLSAENNETIKAYFSLLGLSETLLNKRASELSVGQQQRVAIARALINEPEILIVDEPTSALDKQARDGFMQLLFECVKTNNSTLLFVSHDDALADYFSCSINMSQLNRIEVVPSC